MRQVSRRRFLGSAAAVPVAFHPRIAYLAQEQSAVRRDVALQDCTLIDAGEHCVLPESLAGFARGLEAASIPYRRITPGSIEPAKFVLVPGAVLQSSQFARALAQFARLGSTVIYESGAAYADAEDFRTEQQLLRLQFGLEVGTPLPLWGTVSGRRETSLPYVYYRWPSKAVVRDFSRALPVYGRGISGDVEVKPAAYDNSIAMLRGFPVSHRSRLGTGDFIFLGSPLGPHLASGDREAQLLLETLLPRRQGS